MKKTNAKKSKQVKQGRRDPEKKSSMSSNSALAAAQRLLDAGKPQQAFVAALPLYEKRNELQLMDKQRLLRLLSFAAYQSENVKSISTFASEGRTLCPDGLDFYFISAIDCARAKQYGDARTYAEVYLIRAEKLEKSPNSRGEFDSTVSQKHQLLSAYGVSLCEAREYEAAEKALQEAIRIAPKFESGYINLALVLKAQRRNDEALAIVRQGLQVIPDAKSLKKMLEWSGKRATISACMIVKNEEELLPRCLASIVDVVDEIILVDTGSTDNTVKIAEEYGCTIHHFEWTGDFSTARNESLRHATKDWVFIIDADEEFPPQELHKLRVVTNQQELDIISITCLNKSLETGMVTSFLPSVRLFRRELDLRYYGIVHNRLDIPKNRKVLRADIDLYHYGYDLARDKMDQKLERTRKLLDKQLAENPNDVYANFNLAQLLRGYTDGSGPEKSQLIVEHAGRVIDNPESKDKKYVGQRLMAFHQKAIGLCNLRRFEEAEACCLEALKEKADYLDPMLTLGDIYNYTEQFDKAAEYYRRYLEVQANYDAGDEITNIILHNLEARHKAYFGLGLIAERTRNAEDAVRYYSDVLKNKEPYLDTYIRLSKFLMILGRHEEAIEYFNRAIREDSHSAIAYYGLGCALSGVQRYGESIRAIEKSLALESEHADRWYSLAKVYRDIGNENQADLIILKAASMPTEKAELLFEAGNIYFGRGDFETAIERYNQALSKDSQHIQARLNLGNCFFKTGRFDTACSIYEQVLSMAPDTLAAYRNAGICMARLERINDALRHLMQYVEYVNDDYPVYYVMAELFTKIERFPEAIGCFEKYIKADPKNAQALVQLSDVYLQLGHGESALAGYEQALRLDPNCTGARERIEELRKTQTV
ncbi:MAG: tetratricopeptide repeat protein [Candidatus Zixiibacteriota bacterium]